MGVGTVEEHSNGDIVAGKCELCAWERIAFLLQTKYANLYHVCARNRVVEDWRKGRGRGTSSVVGIADSTVREILSISYCMVGRVISIAFGGTPAGKESARNQSTGKFNVAPTDGERKSGLE